MTVNGIGILGLPLSERDARLVQSLISASTNVEQPVGNVWELDARDIECSNPAWATYLEEIVLKDIWKKLAPHCSRPRLELQSLLLWEATSECVSAFTLSSHLLTTVRSILEYEWWAAVYIFSSFKNANRSDSTVNPHRKTDEFATIHVILPSFYTGGHVQLSFSGCSENYDLSATSRYAMPAVSPIQRSTPWTFQFFDVARCVVPWRGLFDQAGGVGAPPRAVVSPRRRGRWPTS